MSPARRLLLVAGLALAVATAGASPESVSQLTLSPNADTLITGRGDETSTSSAVIGSAASDKAIASEKKSSATETTVPSTSDSESDETASASNSGSDTQEAADAPSSASATVSPDTSDRSTTESQTAATATSASSGSKSTAAVDTLNDSNGTLSSGDSSGFNATTGLPIIFGALACVGAVVMAVTYKKKREADTSANDQRPSSDCEYTGGANFTPDNRVSAAVQDDTPPLAASVSALSSQGSTASGVADFTGTNSSVSLSSPFGSTRCKARVSSPVPSCYSTSEVNMEFQSTCPRHNEGSNVVLTIEEVATTGSSQVAPKFSCK